MPMTFFLAYLGVGFAVYFALRLLFRSTGVDMRGVNALWGALISAEGLLFLFLPLFWPLLIALSILLWAGEYFHLKSKQRDAREVEEAQVCSTKYSRLSMEELLPEQERALREVEEVCKQMPR